MRIEIQRVSSDNKGTCVAISFYTERDGYYLRVETISCLITSGFTYVFQLTDKSPEIVFSISDGPVVGAVVEKYRLNLIGKNVALHKVTEYTRRRRVKY